jgi:hypothetical protein
MIRFAAARNQPPPLRLVTARVWPHNTATINRTLFLARKDPNMFGSLSLAAALALTPAQAGGLQITNVRTTYGELGAVRTDNKYLPGDLFFLAFDVEGLTIAPDGKVSYEMGMQVLMGAKEIIPPKPAARDEYLLLGGSRLPSRAYVILEPNQAPGVYTCKLTVTDRATKASKTLEKSFEVLPKNFGLVGLYTSADDKGEHPAPPSGIIGQNLHVHALVIGFGRNAKQQPDGMVELKIYDEANKLTIPKPMSAPFPAELGPMEELVTFHLLLPFNREGNFRAELMATDKVTGKTSKVTFPIRITVPPK